MSILHDVCHMNESSRYESGHDFDLQTPVATVILQRGGGGYQDARDVLPLCSIYIWYVYIYVYIIVYIYIWPFVLGVSLHWDHATLQHTATHCNTLQHTVCARHVCILGPRRTATRCNTLQHTAYTATQWNTLKHTVCARHVSVSGPQHTATHCNTLQHTATHCNTVKHTKTRCLC